MEKKNENEKTIAEDLVVSKYKLAGNIVNRVLKQVIIRCVSGGSVRDICIYGDELIIEETSKVYKREKSLKKGVASPTCVSVNNCISNFSPLHSEPDYILQDDDVVKIDLCMHIDGFIAQVAHTIVVGVTNDKKVTGRKADVIMAAHFASEAALRLLKPGNDSYTITETVQKVADAYQCKSIENTGSFQLKQFNIIGGKMIIQNPSDLIKKFLKKFEFETYEVYAMEVLISTGEGVGREMDTRTSVYKKSDKKYKLKLKTSRMFYSEVINKYGMLPFTLRNFEDEKKAKLGVSECVSHNLIDPFKVKYEKSCEIVAQFKFTVLLMPNGPHRITGLPFESKLYHSDLSIIDPQLNTLLSSSINLKASKKKKKELIKDGDQAVAEMDISSLFLMYRMCVLSQTFMPC